MLNKNNTYIEHKGGFYKVTKVSKKEYYGQSGGGCSKNPFENYKKIKGKDKLCCPHMMIRATKWGKLTDKYYVKTCCVMCKNHLKKEIKKGNTYKVEGNKLLKLDKKTKRFKIVFHLLTKKQIEKLGGQKFR